MRFLSLFVIFCAVVVMANGSLLGDLFGRILGNNLKDAYGNECVACTAIVALLEQMAQFHNSSVDKVVANVCDLFPAKLKTPCDALVILYGGTVIKLLENDESADTVCQQIGLCRNQTCALFPKKTMRSTINHSGERMERIEKMKISGAENIEKFENAKKIIENPSFVWPWTEVADHLPAVDTDGDFFGVLPTLRGTHWRGKDCNDEDNTIYPGRKINNYGPNVDHNCNGISGVDGSTNKPWEEQLCGGTQQYGFILLGDSAGAHFHVPPEWLTPALINSSTFSDILEILEDEMDWPEQSSSTGFMNETWVGHPVGPVDSIYGRMRERNLCMHRDYQNLGVNGARSGAMNNSISITMARSQKFDNPAFVSYALIGNDVCNGHQGTSHMTKPDEFYRNVLDTLKFLDSKLPNGSHVSFMGLVDGRILYDSMHARIHPIGLLNNDVTYADFYDYMNCLEISPCTGWMNTNAEERNATTERAMELNDVYKQIIANNTFNNFDMTYFDCPLMEVLNSWVAQGGEPWDLIEPIDGFHPNQIANALLTEIQWNLLATNYTYLIPPINPNNQQISQIFGQQGGY